MAGDPLDAFRGKSGQFREKSDVPNEGKLKRVLGRVYPIFHDLIALTSDYVQEWKHYGKKLGGSSFAACKTILNAVMEMRR